MVSRPPITRFAASAASAFAWSSMKVRAPNSYVFFKDSSGFIGGRDP